MQWYLVSENYEEKYFSATLFLTEMCLKLHKNNLWKQKLRHTVWYSQALKSENQKNEHHQFWYSATKIVTWSGTDPEKNTMYTYISEEAT